MPNNKAAISSYRNVKSPSWLKKGIWSFLFPLKIILLQTISSGLAGKSLYLSALQMRKACLSLHQLRIVATSSGLLLNYETPWIKIAVETAIDSCEFQHTVVWISYTGGLVLCVTLAPNHFFRSGISQHLHRTSEHHALKSFGIAKIDASLRVSLVLSHTY